VKSRWRTRARSLVAAVLEETKGQDERAVRKALRDAYPFGERAHYPYKVWCDEVRRARSGLFTQSASCRARARQKKREGASLPLPL
jgi:hypothetical protein